MDLIKVKHRPSAEEKETSIVYDYIDKKWYMYSVISTHYNRAIKCGWTVTTKYVDDDGDVVGYQLEAPARAITIRGVEKRKMSEKQLTNLHGDK